MLAEETEFSYLSVFLALKGNIWGNEQLIPGIHRVMPQDVLFDGSQLLMTLMSI